MLKNKILFFVYFFVTISNSQNKIYHFTTNNGLPHDITYGIFQDEDGYIWIGTDDGLVKYDGQNFKLFSTDDGLRNNFVIDINQLSNGDIVLATWGGGIQIIKNNRILPTKINNDETEKINNLQIWNDNILVKHSSGNIFYKRTATGFKKISLEIEKEILKEKTFNYQNKGNGYISLVNGKLFLFNDIQSTYHNLSLYKRGLYEIKKNKVIAFSKLLEKKIIHSVSSIGKERIAVASYDSIFFFENNILYNKIKLNFKNDASIIFKVEKIDSSEYLVVTTNKKGYKEAYIYSKNFDLIIDLKKTIKTTSSFSDLLIDHEKNIWISTNGDGVFCFNKSIRNLNYLSNQKIVNNEILDINQCNNLVYVLTPDFVTIIKDTNNIKNYKLNGLGRKLTKLNNNSIFVNSTIITKTKNESLYTEISGFNAFYLPNKKNIFVNDSIYIEYLDKKIYTNKRNVNDVIFYKDTLWFGTNVGMFYFDNKLNNLKKKTIDKFSLLSENIRKFTLSKNAFWIATSKGLCKLQNNHITYYTTKNGLIGNQINTVIQDHKGILWIGTNRGVSIFDEKNFVNITTNSGLNSSFINAIFEDSKNRIWIGSDKGISILDNSKKLLLEAAPKFNITQIKSKFRYSVISFNRSKSLVLQYNLDNKGWIDLKEVNGYIDFKNEKKGSHNVQFRAKKQDGVWGNSPIFKFKIELPWHKNIFAVSLILSAFSLLIIFIILNQLRKVKIRNNNLKLAIERQNQLEAELSQVRMNIAQDFHDDLGNKLARISLLSNLAKSEVSEENTKLKLRIEQIENDASYLYKGTRDFVFSLNDESNYLEELVTYLSDFGEEFYRDSPIKFIVKKHIKNNIKLPYYWSKQLIYIFKEALTNAYKHSKSEIVVFSFDYDGVTLIIKCIDNGIGVKKTESKALNGLTNMTKRAEKLGGKLEIQFQENIGTTVLFEAKTTSKGS